MLEINELEYYEAKIDESEKASSHRERCPGCNSQQLPAFSLSSVFVSYKFIYYPVDISTTVFSYSRAVQYHAILHGKGVIARVLLHGPWGYAVS